MISRVYRKHQQIYKCAKKTTRSARTLWLTQLVYQNLSRRSTRHNLVQITFPFWRRKEIWRATDTRPLTYHKLINKALFAIASCYGCRNGNTPLNSKTYRFFACSLQLKNIKYDTDTTHKKVFFWGGGCVQFYSGWPNQCFSRYNEICKFESRMRAGSLDWVGYRKLIWKGVYIECGM